jgi:hypothetical protein
MVKEGIQFWIRDKIEEGKQFFLADIEDDEIAWGL